MKGRSSKPMRWLVLVVLVSVLAYEFQPAKYQALYCLDPQAAKGGQWNSAYDGYFIGANGCVYSPDASLDALPPLIVAETNQKAEPLWYVNGANLRADWVLAHMYRVAQSSHRPVVSIYNATVGGRFFDGINDALRGSLVRPVIQRVIKEGLAKGGDVYFQANSQGAWHLSQALRQVVPLYGAAELKKIHIVTAGAATADFPDGPDYIHLANDKDPVPHLAGVLSSRAHVGAQAQVRRFSTTVADPLEMHFRFFGPLTRAFHSVHGLMAYQPYFPDEFKAER